MKKLLLALLFCLPLPAMAQQASVVAACGTPPISLNLGSTQQLTMDQNGNLCVGAASATTPADVVGNVANGAADAGNPVKVGAVFNTAAPTVTNGQRIDLQADANGAIAVAPKTATLAIADAASNTIRQLSDRASNTISVGSYLLVYNGTTWDRTRVGPYQLAQTPITAVGTGSTGAVTATLAANAAKFTYLCSFDISATGGVATLGPITITNLGGNTFTYQLFSTATGAQLQKTFSPCLQSTAINTAIVVTTTADATASAVDVNLSGFQGP